ncbi:MAG: hypothetical protein HUK22_03440, partial [Thermoguttaceae bacterium]|nr:hypothetical protein [Thermoguttaceae bacterium]
VEVFAPKASAAIVRNQNDADFKRPGQRQWTNKVFFEDPDRALAGELLTQSDAERFAALKDDLAARFAAKSKRGKRSGESEFNASRRPLPRFLLSLGRERVFAYDAKRRETLDAPRAELGENVEFFLPLAGIERYEIEADAPADVRASEKMARVFDQIVLDNPTARRDDPRSLNLFFARLLFCFFAEDSGIFPGEKYFADIFKNKRNLEATPAEFLARVFDSFDVDKSDAAAVAALPKYARELPYVNGALFRERGAIPALSKKTCDLIDECAALDWSVVNPDIFGSMFQAVARAETRAGLGQHYTSVPNIMKVAGPLFLDELNEAFDAAGDDGKKLRALWDRIAKIRVFDPACGSGNFLIIVYKRLRALEMEILEKLKIFEGLTRIRLTNFFGIEIDDFAALGAPEDDGLWTDVPLDTLRAGQFTEGRRTLCKSLNSDLDDVRRVIDAEKALDAVLAAPGETLDFPIQGPAELDRAVAALDSAAKIGAFRPEWLLSDAPNYLAETAAELDAAAERQAEYRRLRAEANAAQGKLCELLPALELAIAPQLDDVESVKRLFAQIKNSPVVAVYREKNFLPNLTEAEKKYDGFTRARARAAQIRAELARAFEPGILDFQEFDDIFNRFKTDYRLGPLNFIKKQYRDDVKTIRRFLLDSRTKTPGGFLAETLRQIAELKRLDAEIAPMEKEWRSLLGTENPDGEIDFKKMRETRAALFAAADKLVALHALLLEENAKNADQTARFGEFNDGLKTDWPRVRAAVERTQKLQTALGDVEKYRAFVARLGAEPDFAERCADAAKKITDAEEILQAARDARRFAPELSATAAEALLLKRLESAQGDDFVRRLEIREAAEKCAKLGLDPFIEAARADGVAPDALSNAYKKAFFSAILSDAAAKREALSHFYRSKRERLVEEFCDLDRKQFEFAGAAIRRVLLARMQRAEFATKDEVKILQHETKKKRRIKPLRKLFGEIAHLLGVVKPCVMTSPLAVSKYFESPALKFDVVIFDEASQVRVENAVGSIVRGEQIIIAGDSKQLPPTNFFQKSNLDADEYDSEDAPEEIDETGAFESILDEAEAADVPKVQLLWHYRRRCESLIAFSNEKFYENKLVTFPANFLDSQDWGVDFVRVPDGVWLGAKDGNPREAERVAERK